MAVAFLNRISNLTKNEEDSPVILQQKTPQGRVCLWNSIYIFIFKIFRVCYNSRFTLIFEKLLHFHWNIFIPNLSI